MPGERLHIVRDGTAGATTPGPAPSTRPRLEGTRRMNRRIYCTCLVALALVAPAFAVGDDKAQASDGKWVSLFDGKTLGGWTIADGTTGEWKVVDGVIHGSGPASH